MREFNVENELLEGCAESQRISVSREEVESNMASVQFALGGTKTTICIIKMDNGFEAVGTSAPANQEDYDMEMGEKLAYEEALNKIMVHEVYFYSKARYLVDTQSAENDEADELCGLMCPEFEDCDEDECDEDFYEGGSHCSGSCDGCDCSKEHSQGDCDYIDDFDSSYNDCDDCDEDCEECEYEGCACLECPDAEDCEDCDCYGDCLNENCPQNQIDTSEDEYYTYSPENESKEPVCDCGSVFCSSFHKQPKPSYGLLDNQELIQAIKRANPDINMATLAIVLGMIENSR